MLAEPLLAEGGPDTDAPAHAPGAAPGMQLQRGNAVACIVILAKTILGAGAACKSSVVHSHSVTATDLFAVHQGWPRYREHMHCWAWALPLYLCSSWLI